MYRHHAGDPSPASKAVGATFFAAVAATDSLPFAGRAKRISLALHLRITVLLQNTHSFDVPHWLFRPDKHDAMLVGGSAAQPSRWYLQFAHRVQRLRKTSMNKLAWLISISTSSVSGQHSYRRGAGMDASSAFGGRHPLHPPGWTPDSYLSLLRMRLLPRTSRITSFSPPRRSSAAFISSVFETVGILDQRRHIRRSSAAKRSGQPDHLRVHSLPAESAVGQLAAHILKLAIDALQFHRGCCVPRASPVIRS